MKRSHLTLALSILLSSTVWAKESRECPMKSHVSLWAKTNPKVSASSYQLGQKGSKTSLSSKTALGVK